MSLLLPQTKSATVRAVQPVDIHGDRYVDLSLTLDDRPDRAEVGRVSASDCPADLEPGDRVQVRFVMGVMVNVTRS